MNRVGLIVAVALALALPALASAQTDLQSSIRAAITQDPRSTNMSSAQIEALVAALSQSAQQSGVTPQDITFGAGPSAPVQSNFCAPYPQYLCVMSATFGFFGPDYVMPLWLASASLLFLLINALLRHHERVHRAEALNLQT